MYDALSGGQLFGVTTTNNHGGDVSGAKTLVFRLVLDPSTGNPSIGADVIT